MENKDAVTSANNWVNELISKLNGATNGVLEVKIGNQTISAFIGTELASFFVANSALLLRLGKETFVSFLILLSEKKQEEAFDLLLDKMNADEIIAQMNANAAELHQLNNDHDAFVAALEKFAISVVETAIPKLLVALLTGGLL